LEIKSSVIQVHDRDAATTQWRKALKGEVNDASDDLAVQLKKAGMGDWEVESTLTEEAQYANSPNNRRRQIPSIMKGLRKWRQPH
jgi:hypothetical protein